MLADEKLFCEGTFSTPTGVIATLRLLFARQAKGKRKLVLWRFNVNNVRAETRVRLAHLTADTRFPGT
jgi:hypothetical protein